VTSALVMISVSSFARSSGIVATQTPPAFITANQAPPSSGCSARAAAPGCRAEAHLAHQDVGEAMACVKSCV